MSCLFFKLKIYLLINGLVIIKTVKRLVKCLKNRYQMKLLNLTEIHMFITGFCFRLYILIIFPINKDKFFYIIQNL